MPTNTYVALNNTVTTGSATTLTWSSIPSTYTDLVIVGYCKAVSPGGATFLTFNGDTATNYSRTRILGTGSAASSVTVANRNNIAIDAPSTEWSNFTVNVQNYSNTTTFKTALNRSNSDLYVAAQVGTWRNTAAITSITLTIDGGSFANGSTFSLYGITAVGVSPAAKATGGDIYTDSQYYYHVFDSTGTFTPLQSLSCDALIVAGGGSGGGTDVGGGGGAGGYRILTSQSVTATNYTVTVGAGGASVGTSASLGNSGTDSTFNGNTSSGGGGGGRRGGGNFGGVAGGSGGGGGGVFAAFTAAGGAGNTPSTTPSQGNNGGNGFPSDGGTTAAAGGGGAGAAATNASASTSTAGGIGSSSYSSTWGVATGVGQLVSGTYYLAGGGGGGPYSSPGGLGGGGAGGSAGTANTGGGGGGSSTGGGGGASGSGGSGVVIIRYLKA